MIWNSFNFKHYQRESAAFQALAELLFCEELDIKKGLFRHKNQIGIETKPFIDIDGNTIGFQAKYYTSTANKTKAKADIVDSIKKAKAKNKNLSKIYLYVYPEFAESPKPNKEKPTFQEAIENEAHKIDIEIIWRVPSHIERQVLLPENKYIYDLFFNLDPNSGDLIDEVKRHNDNILRAIQTEILYNNNCIKVDRNEIISQIEQTINNSDHIIVSGEGGCGKTAILKEFYYGNNSSYPICIFKANELNVSNINDIFRFEHNFSLNQFLEAYQSESKKIFVIDSAEKLAELTNNDILNQLIFKLEENGWYMIFTTRYSYLNDLSFHIKENYQLSCNILDVSLITDNDIENISAEHNITLPNNHKFFERLKNLFYLNLYIQNYSNIDKKANFRSFVDLIWKKRIQNVSYPKDNMHLEREKCFIHIAKERCRTGLFYINAEELPQSALFQLKQDDILGYDENRNGYFITHDIYEEWALEKIISRCYANYIDSKQFFSELGDSLSIRRAFRLWLSEQLSENIDAVKEFINDTFINNDVSQHWKDELVVSILLSNYADVFFTQFENEIIEDDFNIFSRILFLLQIACKEEDRTLQKILREEDVDYTFTKPKGQGWKIVIAFIYKYREEYFENHSKLILPILTDWVSNNKEGVTTRIAGLLALSLIEKKANTKHFYFEENAKKIILKIIYNSAKELKIELQEIFSKVITNKWVNHSAPYEELCSMILEKPMNAIEVIKELPLSIIQLCDLFWQKRVREIDGLGYERNSMENKYCLVDEYKYNYFPASALQTPTFWLLQYAFKEALDFIIDFTNRSVEHYRKSDYGKEDVEEIILHVEDKEIKQYLCWAFWGMYRGIGSPVVPCLLQSIHMSLEKLLLQIADSLDKDYTENLLKYILINSKSTSLTAVICSIVLANPDKFHNTALILFKTIELFHIDSRRQIDETHAKSLYGTGYGLNREKDIYADERLKTCNDKHRNLNLESLFLKYQLLGINGFTEEQNTEFIKDLYKIIDTHKENISIKPEYEKNSFGILLARMDRRNLAPEITKQDNNYIIEFTPKNLSDELRKHSEQATQKTSALLKYSPLKMWSVFKNESDEKVSTYSQYENNPLSALKEVKELIQGIEKETIQIFPTDEYIPSFVCSALIKFYREQLNEGDLSFCKDVIIKSVSQLFSDDYHYQISDGVEAAIHAIPSLMTEYSEYKEDFALIMLFALFDKTTVGNKRVCDYVIKAIHESDMWNLFFNDAQSILLGFIKLKPIYNQICFEKRKTQDAWGRISKYAHINDFESKIKKQFGDFSLKDLSFDIQNIISFNIDDLETIYQLIPSNTRDIIHLDIYKNTLPIIVPQLLVDRRNNEEEEEYDLNIYSLRLHIFRRFANFILERDLNEIDNHLQPFIDFFNATEETSYFLDEVINAEDYKNRCEQFWYIWNKLYLKFVEVCKNPYGFHLNKVVTSYLLAWQWWREGIIEWHSLKEENISFYENVAKDLGHNPNVLYSISKVLNSIGSKFLDDGINWIYTIISLNESLKLNDLESNTLYYLEKLIRKFIFINKEKIKQELRLKNKIISILEFMIERGSVCGYLLREGVL